MTSYKDIAKISGFSEMTVSRVLRNNPNVSPGTRRKILAVAEELNYQRNPQVDSLMKQVRAKRVLSRTHRIAWLYPTSGSLAEGVYGLYLNGAKERAGELGFHIDEFRINEKYSPKRVREILLSRGINGILVHPSDKHDIRYHLDFDFTGFAAVTFGYSVARPDLHRVTSHHTKNQYEILKKLRACGFRDIMHITSLELEHRLNFGWMAPTLAFGKYYKDDMRIRHLTPDEFLKKLEDEPDGEWLPEVVISGHHYILVVLREKGFSVPEDISYITTTCEEMDLYGIETSGMDQCSHEIGRRAMEYLSDLIALNRFGIPDHPTALLVEGVWRKGPTLRAPAGV